MSFDLSDKTAIVTGAAQGIGRSIAEQLGSAGASIMIGDIQAGLAQETADEMRAEGIQVTATSCDVAECDDAEALVDHAVETFGSVDVLVNNAGISGGDRFPDLTTEDFQEVLEVNLVGVFNCSRAAAPSMIDQSWGRIINISSMAGRNISYHGQANYTASKWGVIGLTKHLAWDLGEYGITVNAVCPGSTRTPLVEETTTEAEREETAKKIPLGRWADPAEPANLVRFLASPAGAYMTGTVQELDGGKQLGVRHEI